ncbi:MAG: carboxypeptidase-like regulatory domain-containing protein [Chitinophagales bacterium]
MTQYIHSGFFKSFVLLPLLLPGAYISYAQYKISGTVLDDKNKSIKGANVYLDNTIDGGTTDSMGVFRFTTSEKGNQTIVASEVSHRLSGLPIVITGDMSGIVLHLKANAAHDLDAVVITAGSFEASNDKSKTVLRPLDIVTTAGANADVVKAIEMLPGTQQTGTDNGLFVRGGDASEAAILVDEMVVQNAFFSGPPGVATRSRFGAFNYQGVSFSSGGYSARYGQALSSVLELNTTDLPDKSNVNLGINMAGLYASGTKKWKNSSLDVGGSYNNTAPFFSMATTNFKFNKPPEGGAGNARFVWKPDKNGILKINLNGSYNTSGISVPNPYAGDTSAGNSYNPLVNQPDTIDFITKDAYYYSNVSYKKMFKNKYSLYTAASYSLDQTRNKFGSFPVNEDDHRAQFRIEGKDYFTGRLNLLAGTDIQSFGITKNYDNYFKQQFTETLVAGYTELEWTPIYWLAVKPGVRYEHSTLLNLDNVAPRLSMAIKTGTYSQISLAGGIFYQDPDYVYLLAGLKTKKMQGAVHYITNWQWMRNDRILRLEGYYKNYTDLVRELSNKYDPNSYRTIFDSTKIDNSGYGYAQGIELFWRDKKTMKNLDYWISYSYIDTRRLYANYTSMATPTFIAQHNLNLVAKYFVDKWHTNFSATYSYASGRPYYDQGYPVFLGEKTPGFNNIALTVAYLHSFGKWFTVFYLSIDNITNQHNVFGYRYAYNATGQQIDGSKNAIIPALYRSIFFGVNMSLTQFSKDEL